MKYQEIPMKYLEIPRKYLKYLHFETSEVRFPLSDDELDLRISPPRYQNVGITGIFRYFMVFHKYFMQVFSRLSLKNSENCQNLENT